MRQSARMLGWTVNLIGVIVLVSLASVGYSLIDTLMFKQGIGFGDLRMEVVEGGARLSIPLFVNNTGRFPISNVILTTNVSDHEGTKLVGNRTVLPNVPGGRFRGETHILRLRMADLILEGPQHLLLRDSQLRADMAVRFTYAHLVSLRLQLPNMSLPWGAPLHGLNVGEPGISSFNATHYEVDVPLSFENHAPINIVVIRLRLLDDEGEDLASRTMTVDIPPMEAFSGSLRVLVAGRDLQRLTEGGSVQLAFQTPEFSFGPVEMPYG